MLRHRSAAHSLRKRNSTYFLWDVLTTASFGKEDLVKRSVVNSDVIVAGASRGRTVKAENSRPVDLVYHVDRDALLRLHH